MIIRFSLFFFFLVIETNSENSQSPDGDIIDCVHISKQPAFDHPFIKYHAIQMCPSYLPEGMPEVACDQSTKPITQMWHQNGKCPDHTIPIRRIKEEDVLRAKSVKRYGMKRPTSIPNPMSFDNNKTSILGVHQHAVAASEVDIYYGTNATINLWQPTLGRPNDFSLAQLWIMAWSSWNQDLNTIEAGWQVSQEIYGDNNTRIFLYWTRDAYQTTGCYNLGCCRTPSLEYSVHHVSVPGSVADTHRNTDMVRGWTKILIWSDFYSFLFFFSSFLFGSKSRGVTAVQGSSRQAVRLSSAAAFPLSLSIMVHNMTSTFISRRDHNSVVQNCMYLQDPKDGNWWLQLNSYVLGYWPGSIFSHLAYNASYINWGGEVYTPDANQTTTPMGSGHFPEEGFGKASYIKNIQVLDSSNNLKSPSNISVVAERPNCYNVQNSNNSDWGTSIYFGGPGKNPSCP
ncbi:hypothetical protein EJB05_13146, partial [Eragrostis curvula]